MLNQEQGSVRQLLNHIGANIGTLRSELSSLLDGLPTVTGHDANLQVSNELTRVLNQCDKLAQKRRDQYISSELFVLAAVNDSGALGQLLRKLKFAEKKVLDAIEKIREGGSVSDPNAEDNRQALEKYTINLTQRAEQGKLDPVIGRDEEIRRTLQVLQRRTKNNPVLIGEPGVGKTAIVEGLQRIINGEVRESAQQRVLSLTWALVQVLSIAANLKSVSRQSSVNSRKTKVRQFCLLMASHHGGCRSHRWRHGEYVEAKLCHVASCIVFAQPP